MKAVILAGGKGQRLMPYSAILPKPLMPIEDKPVMEVVVAQLKKSGISEIIVSTGHLAGLLQAYFGSGEKLGVKIIYSKEEKPLGTAGPLALVKDQLDETFLVINGDTLSNISFKSLLKYHRQKKAMVTVCVCNKRVQIELGTLQVGRDGDLKDYIEKPAFEYLASMGIYAMEPSVLKYIKSGVPLGLPDLVKKLVKKGVQVSCYLHKGMWFDIGTMEDYRDAVDIFTKKKDQFFNTK